MKLIGEEQLSPTSPFKVKLIVPDQDEALDFRFALSALEYAREDGWDEINFIIGKGVAIFYRRRAGAIIVPPGSMKQ